MIIGVEEVNLPATAFSSSFLFFARRRSEERVPIATRLGAWFLREAALWAVPLRAAWAGDSGARAVGSAASGVVVSVSITLGAAALAVMQFSSCC
jgi:hypothetical protein